ncbi:MAG: MBL fold metallo-hydrolase [Drouetiella hepatica Uher 2000/2452]|jgi:L-ascorbate metabolism protein UlaG (beta-lactamase superfamily)|uniref:MBL fold metallo-hydrolase n=1 Tax=Drouetiella hepatica Uher 2000/2452 TaxID=904376 RepID=A0A951Q6F9_9CYAN|nr:MBL fold metallo-hydrolase [Drouetiella hepatica Uher 2000/2452]
MYLTWLDNNSWLIEIGEQRILLDPWLVGSLVFGNMPWLFKSTHTQPSPIPENIDLILLSQGLEDHAHTPTLQQLDRSIPVVASPNAAKVAQKLGYSQITALAHGESYASNNRMGDRLTIQAVPGAPIGPLLVENGYLLTLASGTSLYYEPHGFHSATLQAVGSVDVIITPLISLEIPLLGSVIQGSKTALQVIEWLKPQVVVPTAAGGNVQSEGLLTSVLQEKGSIEALRATLADRQIATQIMTPKPGDRFQPIAVPRKVAFS